MSKKEGPCQTDLLDQRDVIQRFHDFISVGHLLNWDLEKEITKFRAALRAVGWGDKQLALFQQYAAKNTQWEYDLPRALREQGNQKEYRDAHYRSS